MTISEFFKFLISSALMVRSSLRARRDPAGTHELVPIEAGDVRENERSNDGAEMENEKLIYGGGKPHGRGSLVGDYVRSLGMVSVENRYGFAKLALLYA